MKREQYHASNFKKMKRMIAFGTLTAQIELFIHFKIFRDRKIDGLPVLRLTQFSNDKAKGTKERRVRQDINLRSFFLGVDASRIKGLAGNLLIKIWTRICSLLITV